MIRIFIQLHSDNFGAEIIGVEELYFNDGEIIYLGQESIYMIRIDNIKIDKSLLYDEIEYLIDVIDNNSDVKIVNS